MTQSKFRNVETQGKTIRHVRFRVETDDSPDLSFLGNYQSNPGPNDKTIDRQERGDMERGQHRYFVACNSGEETGNPNSVEEDYQRMEALDRGDWCMMYCYAEAEIVLCGVIQTIRSGGLGGVESDSEDGYFDEIKKDELDHLKNILQGLGFFKTEIAKAFKKCEDLRA